MISQSDQDADIFAAQQFVIQHNLGDVLSQSFGEGEVCQASSIFAATHQLFAQAAAEHMSVFASAGDQGSSQPACNGNGFFKSVGTPASDPLVTGVGGTHLNADLTTGAYEGETVWNDSGTVRRPRRHRRRLQHAVPAAGLPVPRQPQRLPRRS